MQASGSPPSAFQVPYDTFRQECGSSAASSSHVTDYSVDTSVDSSEEINLKELDYEFICFFLSSPRLSLYRSIDFRCEDMISGGSTIKVIFYIFRNKFFDGMKLQKVALLKGLHKNSFNWRKGKKGYSDGIREFTPFSLKLWLTVILIGETCVILHDILVGCWITQPFKVY